MTTRRTEPPRPPQDYDQRLGYCEELARQQRRTPTTPVYIETARDFLDCFAVDGTLIPELAKILDAREVCAFVELIRSLGSSRRAERLLSEYVRHDRQMWLARHADDQGAGHAEGQSTYWSPVAHP